MITRTVRVQLVAFVLITVLGVTYVGLRYAGLDRLFGATTYPVQMQLTDSGGIFTDADVTYRGVSVGRVGPLELTGQGVEVQLNIDKDSPPIPADLDAEVHNLSAIGEQYVDLQPARADGPMLEAGSVIPASRTSTPVPVEELVLNLDEFVRSVPLESLRTVVDELGTGFEGTGPELQTLLDTTDAFTRDAVAALPQTLTLIRDGRVALETQNEQSGEFASFSEDLALLADQLRTSDPDIRRLLVTGPRASAQLSGLLDESGMQLGDVVGDLLTVSRIVEPRQDGLRQILATYPAVAAGAYVVVPPDGTGAHLGLVVNNFDPFSCTLGYDGTDQRTGIQTEDVPVNEEARCIPTERAPNVRGAHNAPRAGGAPAPPAGGDGSADPGDGADSADDADPGAPPAPRHLTDLASALEG